MSFELAALPYPFDALEPHLDARTMEIHHGKHHATYVANLNKALESHPEWAGRPLEDLLTGLEEVPEQIRTAVRNNGGGHANHTLFWQIMGPQGAGEPKGALGQAIQETFGSFQTFQEQFSAAGIGRFGSGWVWLVADPSGALKVYSTPNQDSPLMQGDTPLLGVDVWEHAYYLHYQNRRADYLKAWWNVVDWEQVTARWEKTR